MTDLKHIDAQQAFDMLQRGEARLVDIRDAQSFAKGHAKEAYHLTNDTLPTFFDLVDEAQPIIVVCYHGHSSQSAGHYLIQNGYQHVYSIDGGMEAWLNMNLPIDE
jgi:thiosulfate sulfurtransferase